MHTLIERLDRWYHTFRPAHLKGLNPGADDAALQRLRDRASAPLPPLLEELLSWHDGTAHDCYEGFQFNRHLMSCDDIVTVMDELEELRAAGEFEEPFWWNEQWLPFLDNGGGDFICVDLGGCFDGVPGQIVEFWHDDADRAIAYPSFEAWLETFVVALERGMFAEENGGLHPNDDGDFDAFVAARHPGYPIPMTATGECEEEDDEDWGEDDEDDE